MFLDISNCLYVFPFDIVLAVLILYFHNLVEMFTMKSRRVTTKTHDSMTKVTLGHNLTSYCCISIILSRKIKPDMLVCCDKIHAYI